MKLEIRKFDLKNIKSDSTVLLMGKRATGKSFCLKDLMYHLRDLPMGVVISPTESANQFFGEFIPSILVYDEYTPDIIAKFVDRQRKITLQYNAEKKKYGRTDIDPRGFIILDDCLYDKSWLNDKNIRFLLMNGRHVFSFCVFTSQQILGVPPSLRSNLDYIIICRENIINNREKIYRHYAGMLPTFDVFNQVFTACTNNYEVLIVDNRTQSNALSDQIFWFKAAPRAFQMCSKELWQIQALEEERRALGYDKKTEDNEDELDYDPTVFTAKKHSIPIRVRKTS